MDIGSSFSAGQSKTPSVVLSVVLILVELIFSGHISIFGCTPHLLLILTAALAFTYGSTTGCVSGFALGLLTDLLGSGTVGIFALLYCVCGYVAGRGARNLLSAGWRMPTVIFAIMSLCFNFIYIVFIFLLGTNATFGIDTIGYVLLSTIVDALFGFVVFLVMAKVYARSQSRLSSRPLH
jgi:rod shape-determining protein MreD